MYRTLGLGSLVLGLVCLVPGEADAQKKKKKGEEVPPATAADYAQLSQLKEVVGKLVYAESSAQNLMLRLDYPHIEPNPNYRPNTRANNNISRDMQRIMNDQAALARVTNPVQRQQRMRQLVIDMQRLQNQLVAASVNVNPNSLPYKIVAESKDFELPVDEKIVVRRQTLPYTYDDKGNPVQYSKEDIEKLRGTDKSKPGYQAKYEDLTSGQIVKLYLKMPPKTTASSSSKDAKDAKDGDAKEPAPPEEVRKPRVTMILILQDSNEALNNQAQQQKKKKN